MSQKISVCVIDLVNLLSVTSVHFIVALFLFLKKKKKVVEVSLSVCNKIKFKKLKFRTRNNPKHGPNFKKKEAQHPRVNTGSSRNPSPVLQSLAPSFSQTSKTGCL